MKKVLLSIFTVLLSITLSAQISITSDDIVGAGKVVLEATDTLPSPSITPGPSGPDQTWDFSSLSVDCVDTMWFANPDWTPYYEHFPAANLAALRVFDSELDSADMYIYFEKNVDEFAIVGMAMEVEEIGFVIMPCIPKETIAEFPVDYLNSSTNDFELLIEAESPYPPADSIRIKISITKSIEVDAWGDITIPLGTFNSLRINETRIEIDSMWMKLLGVWNFLGEIIDTTYNYSWWTDDDAAGYVLATLNYEQDTKVVSEATFLKASPYSYIEENQNSIFVNVYPNPVSSNINFLFEDKTQGIIEIFDFTGKNIKEIQLNNVHEVIINMSKYPAGIYLYSIIGKNGKIIHSGKICKE
ncbi:MAG: T9SS type A sorting domain-containing protein [Mariniphaga sp.]|nr:T9SS type A sorting domain-containing protein [Mariniphaga sp.]